MTTSAPQLIRRAPVGQPPHRRSVAAEASLTTSAPQLIGPSGAARRYRDPVEVAHRDDIGMRRPCLGREVVLVRVALRVVGQHQAAGAAFGREDPCLPGGQETVGLGERGVALEERRLGDEQVGPSASADAPAHRRVSMTKATR